MIMATFFGEVLPVLSRAVDEEDDDEDEIPVVTETLEVQWTAAVNEIVTTNKHIACDVLIISVGATASAFIQVHLLDQPVERIATVTRGNSTSTEADGAGSVYRLSSRPSTIIVQCGMSVMPQQAYSWTHQILPKLDLTQANVTVLCSVSSAEYKSEISPGDLVIPFLRALKSTELSSSPVCPYLEQPNTISGLPSQIMTYCQLHKVKAVLYACYSDSIYLNHDSVKAFNPVLTVTPIKDFTVKNPKVTETLNKLINKRSPHTDLYI